MKCKYVHCKHESKDIPEGEEVKNGGGYWHKDCLDESLVIREIIKEFTERVNPNVVVAQLRRVINDIVYVKGIDAHLLYFGLMHYILNNIPLNYPGGLYYVLQNRDVQKEWNKIQATRIKNNFEIKEDNTETFQYKPSKERGFQDILS